MPKKFAALNNAARARYLARVVAALLERGVPRGDRAATIKLTELRDQAPLGISEADGTVTVVLGDATALPRPEEGAFLALGQSYAQTSSAVFGNAIMAACYALGADERYGEVPAWCTLEKKTRENVASLVDAYPNTLKVLEMRADPQWVQS